jgi:mRNA interferase RelE/StbE
VILTVENATSLSEVPNIKKLYGFKKFYRIRIGDFRIGIELDSDTVWFITVAERKDIYKKFP